MSHHGELEEKGEKEKKKAHFTFAIIQVSLLAWAVPKLMNPSELKIWGPMANKQANQNDRAVHALKLTISSLCALQRSEMTQFDMSPLPDVDVKPVEKAPVC